MSTLDSDLLRTFLAIEEAGSVTGGAARIGRSQSAASLQIQQLEERIGKPLFRRHGRGVVLTAAGETLSPVARGIVSTLDRTLSELRGEGLKGRLRIGVPDDHSRASLARIISGFAAQHRDVELEVHCALGSGFGAALRSGALDLAVHEVPEPSPRAEILRENQLVWMRSRRRDFDAGEPLPVALFDRDCWWRDRALADLEAAGRDHRVIFTSESSVGVHAAVRAGMAVGLLSSSGDAEGLQPLAEFPVRHPTYLVLQTATGASGPVCEAMSEAIRRTFSV